MTVERQELRNKNTISTVRMAPSIRVWRTLLTDTRMGRELSVMGSSLTPGGSWPCNSATALTRPSTTWIVFSSCDFCTDIKSVRWPL